MTNINQIKILIRETILKELDIDESGFARVRNIMTGNVDNIKTIGILTAENPRAETTSSQENNKLMNSLYSDLRSKKYGFIKAKGYFGQPETSVIVPNISMEEINDLKIKYNQESVIFGKRHHNTFSFFYIGPKGIEDVKTVSFSGNDIQNKEDFYSAIKGRKFIIPFFDRELNNTVLRKNSGEVVDLNKDTKKERVM